MVFMKKPRIVTHPTIEDIRQMVDLDAESYDYLDRGIVSKCLEWLQICPDIYTIIKSQDMVIGYINFVPISESCYNKFKTGLFKDYMIDKSDILPFKKGNNFCLFMSIVIKREFRQENAILILLNAFKNKINSLKQRGCLIKSIIADCISTETQRFVVDRFNAKCLCSTISNSKIFEFNF